jgi:hypothetical protein
MAKRDAASFGSLHFHFSMDSGTLKGTVNKKPSAVSYSLDGLAGFVGPGGVQVYRILVRWMLEPTYIELMEDRLELAPAKG